MKKDEEDKPDDVLFTHAILNNLERWLCVDCDRVYATGLSNGAMMCHRLAVEMPNRIRQLRRLAACWEPMFARRNAPFRSWCFKARVMKCCQWTALRSRTVCIADLLSDGSDHAVLRLRGRLQSWRLRLPNLPDCYDDDTTIRLHTYTDCKPGIEVILVEICGGGHQWPQKGLPFKYLSAATEEIDANEMMWCFFQKHTLSERGCICGCGGMLLRKRKPSAPVTARVTDLSDVEQR